MPPARKIDRVHPAPEMHWAGDGFRLISYLSPEHELAAKLNPVSRIDYQAPYDFPVSDSTRRGVGPQAYQGCDILTLAFEGHVAHLDSSGAHAVIRPGDVQWVTTASGVTYREEHEEGFARRGGTMHSVQLSIDMPTAHRLATPRYLNFVADQISAKRLPNAAGMVRVIAGEYQGVKGPAAPSAPIRLFDGRLMRRGRVEFCIPTHENAALLLMKGNVLINREARVAQTELVVFEREGERIAIEAEADSHWLLISGEPIAEAMSSLS